MTKRQLATGLIILLGAAVLGLSIWGWSKIGLAALQTGLGYC